MHSVMRIVLSIAIVFPVLLFGQDTTKVQKLEKRIQILEKKIEQSEMEQLLKEAETEAKEKKKTETKTFKSGQRSLQATNPEISIAADAFGQYIMNDENFTEDARTGMHFRVAEMQIQSNLDPFSTTKVILEFRPGEFEFAEAYMTWHKIFKNVSLTAGKFRQQFGVVNRWHAHSLDQYDFPLALTTILGDEGLNQLGVSFNWLMPAFIGDANNFTLQITNGQNEHLFAGNTFSFPAVLGRFQSYYDLSENTYLDIGVTGMLGNNNLRGYDDVGNKILESRRLTKLAGFDVTYSWVPVNRAWYTAFLWRTELYYADKEMLAGDNIKAGGGYSYIDYKFKRQWHIGSRFDYTQPFLANNTDLYLYQIVPYVTWWQSPWVKLRMQYNYLYNKLSNKNNQTFRIQVTWAMGPHKHDRY